MGHDWGPLFFDAGDVSHLQLGLLFFIYGALILQASTWISSGSELLLLIPSIAGLVGSIVLPILGAVPDGMMVLFSGMGPDAQTQVAVGVGALAGSTIMLLTATWFLAILGGRVDLESGEPKYKRPARAPDDWAKLTNGMGLSSTGVGVEPLIKKNAKVMFCTSLIYFIIQIPAAISEATGADQESQAHTEQVWAYIGLVACVLAFVAYLVLQYKLAQAGDPATETKEAEAITGAIKDGTLSLAAALSDFWAAPPAEGVRIVDQGRQNLLAQLSAEDKTKLRRIIGPFFALYDVNRDKTIDETEFAMILRDLRVNADKGRQQAMFAEADTDQSGKISFDEFVQCIAKLTSPHGEASRDYKRRKSVQIPAENEEEEEEEEEEVDMPEDLADLPPDQQRKAVLRRAALLMAVGTAIVLVVSDPMVGVLAEIGDRVGISAFYVSFVLGPLASNASELVAGYSYAQKKTRKSMTISLTTLVGAAIMNNTFCLAIFMALVAFKGLAWEFTAETLVIIIVEWIMCCIGLFRPVMSLGLGCFILALYPLSIVFVAFMENVVGID